MPIPHAMQDTQASTRQQSICCALADQMHTTTRIHPSISPEIGAQHAQGEEVDNFLIFLPGT